MPIKCSKYELIAESTNVLLSKAINIHLKKGWELYGPPMIVDALFFQAVVKPCGKNDEED